MKVDYHVHPNLPTRHPEKKLAKLWQAVERHRLDAFICAEHSFKDAPGAYRALVAAKPKHVRCQVFPGAELATSDGGGGVDVVAFAREDWYDEHPRLLEPFSMTLAETVRTLEASGLRWFIPHPTIMGTALRRQFPGQGEMREFLASVPAFEARNGTHLLIEHLCTHPLARPFLRGVRDRLRASAEPRLDLYFREHAFLAVGSDAHHPRDLGYCVEFPGRAAGRRHVFERLTRNTDIQTLHLPAFSYALPRLLATAGTAFHEWCMRKAGRSETVQELRTMWKAEAES
ncbi:MAG: hypothetical protein WCV62_00745 [Candidatus Peribacteraceae bacterium]|jgi:hypothetical protein